MKKVKQFRKLVRLIRFGKHFQASMNIYRMEEYSAAKAKGLMRRACAVNRDYEDSFYNLHVKISHRSVPQIESQRAFA